MSKKNSYHDNYDNNNDIQLEKIKDFCRFFIKEEVNKVMEKNKHIKSNTKSNNKGLESQTSRYQQSAKKEMLREIAGIALSPTGFNKNTTKKLGEGIINSILNKI